MIELPYRCPRLKANFLTRQACQSNQGRAAALLGQGAVFLGHLHHCQECQGKELEEVNSMDLNEAARQGGENMALIEAIDQAIKQQGHATRRGLAEKLGLDLYQVKKQLKKLEDAGRIQSLPGETKVAAVKIIWGCSAPPEAPKIEAQPAGPAPPAQEVEPAASLPGDPVLEVKPEAPPPPQGPRAENKFSPQASRLARVAGSRGRYERTQPAVADHFYFEKSPGDR